MATPPAIAALSSPSTDGERELTAISTEPVPVQGLVDMREALLRLLAVTPPDLTAIQALFHERMPAARTAVVPLDTVGDVKFLSQPPQDPVVLVVAPQADRVCLAVDIRLPADLLCLALLHGMGHVLLGHVRPGDEYGHRDTATTLRGAGAARRWDRQVREVFASLFSKEPVPEPTSSHNK